MKFWVFNNTDIQIIIALVVDILIGDPHQLPHIVIYYGKILNCLEQSLNKGKLKILKGAFGVFILLSVVGLFSLLLYLLKPYLKVSTTLFAIWLMSSCLAMKSLSDHALNVYRQLIENNINKARQYTSYIVGRDTDNLDEAELTRAVVETVAENTVDGVTAPLFYLLCLGLPGALLYKAINTLDSMWGHRNERFELFGKVAARLDDIANYVPARLTAVAIVIASTLLPSFKGRESIKIIIRDKHKHPSPNSGLSEAAFAGAMGIKLGGINYYQGVISKRGVLGDGSIKLDKNHILQSLSLMQVTSLIFAAIGIALRVVIR